MIRQKEKQLTSNLQGKFIVIDGPDGCGKSTQSRMLAEWIRGHGVEVESYRDPGTTAIGEKIRQILLSPEHVSMDTRSEFLLYMAARAQLWSEKIKPALENGNCVVLDRWLSSTCAYQGYAGGFGLKKVIEIAERLLDRAWPDLTIILDVDTKTASTRLKEELDRMELKGDDYHRKVREGFLALAQGRKDFAVLNASQGIESIHRKIIELVEAI